MAHIPKIATCCYCGTRAALTLSGKTRHELSCSACGAPLHDLKRLRKDAVLPQTEPKRTRKPDFAVAKKKPKKKKKRKGLASRFLDEAWDVIEDIFD